MKKIKSRRCLYTTKIVTEKNPVFSIRKQELQQHGKLANAAQIVKMKDDLQADGHSVQYYGHNWKSGQKRKNTERKAIGLDLDVPRPGKGLSIVDLDFSLF